MRARSAIACKYVYPTASTTKSRASLNVYSADFTLAEAARVALIDFQSNNFCDTAARASKYENGPTADGTLIPPKLSNPNSDRFVLESATKGDAVTCGNNALNCSQR